MLPEKPTGVGFPCANRQVWDKLAATADGKKMVKSAVSLLKQKYPELSDELYLQFTKNGNRSNYETVYSKCYKGIVRLTLAECLENQGRFMPKLEEFLDKFLSEKSWVLPAHDGRLLNFNNEELYPDLVCSYVTAMLAYVDWFLQDKLKPETRKRIRHEAYRRAFKPYQDVIHSGIIGNGMWWMTSLHNWNAVCTSNIVCASMILMDSRHDRAEVLAAMETSNTFFYRGYTPDGYCNEGLGYWSYGFGHYLMMCEIVLASTNGKLDIFDDDPVVRKCCEFPRNIMIEDGVAPAYADCSLAAQPELFSLAVIQRRYPEALLKPVPKLKMPVTLPRFALFSIMDYAPAPNAKNATMPPSSFFDAAGILICRSKDEAGNTFGASIKGGNNAEAHNHNDVGSYVIVANKKPLICDPGSEVYTSRTFSSERYTSNIINSYGHDVPVVAGKLQRQGEIATGVISETTFSNEKDSILIDMTSCYDVPELLSLTRRFTFDRAAHKVIVTDNVIFNSPQTFEDTIITNSQYKIDSNASILFHDEKSAIVASISVTGADWSLGTEVIKNPKRVSPTRIGIKLDKPVTKAQVVCTYEFKPEQ